MRRMLTMLFPLLGVMAGCTKNSSASLAPSGTATPPSLLIDKLTVWPISAPAGAPSTYGIDVYLKSAGANAHVTGATLSLKGDDESVTGRECRSFASPIEVRVGYPTQIADASICRVNAPAGTASTSATLAISYWDDLAYRGDVLRTTVSVPVLTDEPELVLDEFTLRRTPGPAGYMNYDPMIVVHETHGGGLVITALRLNAQPGGPFEDECVWQSPSLNPCATWTSASLSYCEPYFYSSTPPSTVTLDLTYMSPVGSRTSKTLHAAVTVAP
jgi:hypothetical protein